MDFEDGVTVHLYGEQLAIYQVGLSVDQSDLGRAMNAKLYSDGIGPAARDGKRRFLPDTYPLLPSFKSV